MLKDLAEELLGTMRTELAFAKLPNRSEYNVLVSEKEVGDKNTNLDAFVDDLINAIPGDATSLKENYFVVNNSKITPGY